MKFYRRFPRDFANEFDIGVATTEADAEQYEEEGFTCISQEVALREMCVRPPQGQQLFRKVTVDGDPHRFESDARLARQIRNGYNILINS